MDTEHCPTRRDSLTTTTIFTEMFALQKASHCETLDASTISKLTLNGSTVPDQELKQRFLNVPEITQRIMKASKLKKLAKTQLALC